MVWDQPVGLLVRSCNLWNLDRSFPALHSTSGRLTLPAALFLATLSHAQMVKPLQAQDFEIEAQVRSLAAVSGPRVQYIALFSQKNTGNKVADQQAPGNITGTILDQTGAVSVGAKVRLTGKNQSLSRETVSGGNGQF